MPHPLQGLRRTLRLVDKSVKPLGHPPFWVDGRPASEREWRAANKGLDSHAASYRQKPSVRPVRHWVELREKEVIDCLPMAAAWLMAAAWGNCMLMLGSAVKPSEHYIRFQTRCIAFARVHVCAGLSPIC